MVITLEEFLNLPLQVITFSKGKVKDFIDEDTLTSIYDSEETHDTDELGKYILDYMNSPSSLIEDNIQSETFIKI